MRQSQVIPDLARRLDAGWQMWRLMSNAVERIGYEARDPSQMQARDGR